MMVVEMVVQWADKTVLMKVAQTESAVVGQKGLLWAADLVDEWVVPMEKISVCRTVHCLVYSTESCWVVSLVDS